MNEQQAMAYVGHASTTIHRVYQKVKAQRVAHLSGCWVEARRSASPMISPCMVVLDDVPTTSLPVMVSLRSGPPNGVSIKTPTIGIWHQAGDRRACGGSGVAWDSKGGGTGFSGMDSDGESSRQGGGMSR